MAKKSGSRGGARPKGNGGKKASGNKPKKAGMFKALKKQEQRAGVVSTGKSEAVSSGKNKSPVAKRPARVPEEFRNFDERMAAKNSRRPGTATATAATPKPSSIAPPTFVVAAPTFQFNSQPVQQAPPVREAEGFQGFLTAMQAPKDAPAGNVDHEARKSKAVQPEYRAQNVYAVLDNGEDEQQAAPTGTAAPTGLMQPATFTFATAAPRFSLQPPAVAQQQVAAPMAAGMIDPDL